MSTSIFRCDFYKHTEWTVLSWTIARASRSQLQHVSVQLMSSRSTNLSLMIFIFYVLFFVRIWAQEDWFEIKSDFNVFFSNFSANNNGKIAKRSQKKKKNVEFILPVRFEQRFELALWIINVYLFVFFDLVTSVQRKRKSS